MRLRCYLRAARGKRSLRQVAAKAKVSPGVLSMVERGRLLPTDEQTRRIERAYGLKVEDWYEKRALLAIELDERDA